TACGSVQTHTEMDARQGSEHSEWSEWSECVPRVCVGAHRRRVSGGWVACSLPMLAVLRPSTHTHRRQSSSRGCEQRAACAHPPRAIADQPCHHNRTHKHRGTHTAQICVQFRYRPSVGVRSGWHGTDPPIGSDGDTPEMRNQRQVPAVPTVSPTQVHTSVFPSVVVR
ncbi:hypothetical protein BC831DRAFT_458953, partial [Entophlyctis helioformis]